MSAKKPTPVPEQCDTCGNNYFCEKCPHSLKVPLINHKTYPKDGFYFTDKKKEEQDEH